jgi:hypothetical protein
MAIKHHHQAEGVGMSDQKLQALLDTCDGSIRDLMRAAFYVAVECAIT